jgi:hypothetical protein
MVYDSQETQIQISMGQSPGGFPVWSFQVSFLWSHGWRWLSLATICGHVHGTLQPEQLTEPWFPGFLVGPDHMDVAGTPVADLSPHPLHR